MKRFLPLLIILPLLIWVGCEEENNEENGGSETPFTFSDEFVKHRTISRTYNSQNGSSTFNHTWDGLNATVVYESPEGQQTFDELYNEYGSTVSVIFSSERQDYYYLDDGWRNTAIYFISDGDTIGVWSWEWDGLTRTRTSGSSLIETFNQYGQEIANYDNSINEWVYHTLSEDGRRMLVKRGSENCNGNRIAVDVEIWTWNENEVEVLRNPRFQDNCIDILLYTYKSVRVYDEYYNIISDDRYTQWSTDEWEPNSSSTTEFDYNSPFTPITLTP